MTPQSRTLKEEGMSFRIFVIGLCVILQACALPKYRVESKIYNPSGLAKERLSTVICKQGERYAWASISGVYNSERVQVMNGVGCNDELEYGHHFQPGIYLFSVTCHYKNYQGFLTAILKLEPSKNYNLVCVLENKTGRFGWEEIDKVRLEIREIKPGN